MSEESVVTRERICLICGHGMSLAAKKCKYCNSPQYERQCVVCGKNLPYRAKHCSECKSYQNWRRHFGMSQTVLALLVALVSVMIPLLKVIEDWKPWHSRTLVVFQSATDEEINLSVLNTGRKPSVLRRFHLSFRSPAIDDVYLDIKPSGAKEPSEIVPADSRVVVTLLTSSLKRNVPWRDLTSNLKGHSFKLTVTVDESNGDAGERSTEITAARLMPFIRHYAPQGGPP